MSKKDDKNKKQHGHGVRETHTDTSSYTNNVISMREWVESEKEAIINHAENADKPTHEHQHGQPPTQNEQNDDIKLFDEEETDNREKKKDSPSSENIYTNYQLNDMQCPNEDDGESRAVIRKSTRIVSIITAGIIFLTLLLLAYFLLIVDTIEISGLETYSEQEIMDKSGLSVGKHMWLNDIQSAHDLITQDPYIAQAVITRVYPDKITIEITERHEMAVIVGMNTHAIIDNEGYVLWIGERSSYEGLMRIYGTGSSGYSVNQRIGEETSFNSRTLAAILSAINETDTASMIESLDISNPLSIYLTTCDGMKVQMGQSDDAADKLAKMKIVMKTVDELGLDKHGTLDISVKGDPVYSPPEIAAATVTIVGDTLTGDPTGDDTGNADNTPASDASPLTTDSASPSAAPSPSQEAQPSPSPTRNPDDEPGFSG